LNKTKLFRRAEVWDDGQTEHVGDGRTMRKKALLLGAAAIGALAALFEAHASADRDFSYASALFNALVAEKNVNVARGLAFGPLERQKLDVYKPEAGRESRGIVIFYYGGGWRSGERAMYRFVGAALAARGFTAVIPDYRLYPDSVFPDFMEDAALAYGFVDRELNTGAKKLPVALMGHSAGGYIAALLALDPEYLDRDAPGAPRPAAVVGLAGPYAFDPTTWPSTKDIFTAAAGRADAARPVAFASPEAPPMFLARGADDDVVAPYNADELEAALRARGVPVENRLYPGLGHVALVLAISKPFRWRAPVLADSIAFLEGALKRRGITALR
jgi:acetyl esterase/lipase